LTRGGEFRVDFRLRGGPASSSGLTVAILATSDAGWPGVADADRVLPDYVFTVSRSASSARRVDHNLLWAQSFEEREAAFTRYATLTPADRRGLVRCAPGAGFGGDCHLRDCDHVLLRALGYACSVSRVRTSEVCAGS
jgi:hypothetical protein